MFKCKICHLALPAEEGEYVLCSECDQGLHFDCSITKTTWRRYDNEKRESWKCNECRKTSKKKNDFDDDDDDEDNSEVDYEEEYDMEDELGQMYQKDPDSVRRVSRRTTKIVNRSPFSIISPIMRRDCHQEVYAGSHCYPGEGVYLLKFDNSYSLWRSKTLYYRVYYTR
uniref:Golgi resident protein GCP60 n=1 Tax=Cacopsylla melanoneura TaxID=428564 RepID=A0A8D8WQZ8_9HEMI